VRPHLTLLTSLALTFFITGCGSSDGGGSPGVDAAAGGSDGPTAVTYQDVKPLFVKKCAPCHAPGGVGAPFHTLADSYSTANKPADSNGACPGKKIGECTLVMVQMGFMPFGKNCTGDPAKDSGNDACLTAAEQKQLQDWIAGGLLEK
jgi:hypothetical protein